MEYGNDSLSVLRDVKKSMERILANHDSVGVQEMENTKDFFQNHSSFLVQKAKGEHCYLIILSSKIY